MRMAVNGIGNNSPYSVRNDYSVDAKKENNPSAISQSSVQKEGVCYEKTIPDSVSAGLEYIQGLEKQIGGTKFFVGTVSYGQTYGNSSDVNFVVNPKFLGKLGTDEATKKQFEEDVKFLNDFSRRFRQQQLANGREIISQGWFCDENGNWGGWTVSRPIKQSTVLQDMADNAEKIRQELAPIKCTDRDWLIYTVRFINEKTEDSMKLFAECLSQTDFSDTRRIMTLAGEAFSAIKASIVPKGNRYAAKRALCTASYSCKVDEIWNGISQFFTLLKISEENPEELAGRFKKITEKLFASGAILHITADGETLKKVETQLPAFLAETRLKPVSSAKKITEEELEKMILLKGEEKAMPHH